MLFLNFEDIRLSGFETSDFVRLNAEIEKRKVKTLFFDEIQMADKWEIFIHQKLNEGYLVYISGSNASMLSRELGTHLTGRHLSMELYPFSYPEFLTFNNLENTVVSFDDYQPRHNQVQLVAGQLIQISSVQHGTMAYPVAMVAITLH